MPQRLVIPVCDELFSSGLCCQVRVGVRGRADRAGAEAEGPDAAALADEGDRGGGGEEERGEEECPRRLAAASERVLAFLTEQFIHAKHV